MLNKTFFISDKNSLRAFDGQLERMARSGTCLTNDFSLD